MLSSYRISRTVWSVTESKPLSEVVGQNARAHRIRHNATLDDVARAARDYGLKWNTGRVGDLESGRIPATFPTLFTLAAVLGDVTGEPVSLVDLVHVDGWVEINSTLTVSGRSLADALQGKPVTLHVRDVLGAREELDEAMARGTAQFAADNARLGADSENINIGDIQDVMRNSGVTEDRIAKQLDVSDYLLACISLTLWGASFSSERDRRAGADANAQRRGRVTRELKTEITSYLERHSGDSQ